MPSEATIQVTGIPELLDKLGRVERAFFSPSDAALQQSAIARSLRKAMAPTKETAFRLAPDDPDTPGSRVSKSLKISVIRKTATSATAKTGTSGAGFVGLFSELGTSHQPKREWLGPAYQQTQQRDLEILEAELGDEIRKIYG